MEGIPGVHVESAVGYPVEDVEAYIKALKGKGLLASAIQKQLTGLKKFYEHCQKNGIETLCETGFESIRDRKG